MRIKPLRVRGAAAGMHSRQEHCLKQGESYQQDDNKEIVRLETNITCFRLRAKLIMLSLKSSLCFLSGTGGKSQEFVE